MRLKRAIVAFAVLSLLAAACGDDGTDTTGAVSTTGVTTTTGAPDEEIVLRGLMIEPFNGWNTNLGGSMAANQTYVKVFDTLLRFSSDGLSLEPGLAEEWAWDREAQTITLTLQENARFSNGDPVTPEDVIFSQGVWAAGPNYGFMQEIVTGVTGEGRTVVFQLGSPDNTYLGTLAAPIFAVYPKDFAGMTEEEYWQNPIGAGPFKVDSWSPGGRIVLSANEYFYDPDRPYVDKVIVETVPDEVSRKLQFDSGQADIVEYLAPMMARQYDPAVVVAAPHHAIEHVALNVTLPPFDDLLVRQAVAYAIDYEGMATALGQEWYTLPEGILPPNMATWAPPTKPYFRQDLARARELMAQSSAAGGAAVELIYPPEQEQEQVLAQILQANLTEIGITVTLTPLETGAFADRAFALDSEMAMWNYGAVSPEMADPLVWILFSQWLFSGTETDTLAGLMQAYATAATPEEAKAVISQIQDEAIDMATPIALTQGSFLTAVAPGLTGVNVAPWGMFYYDTIRKEG